MPSFIVKDCVAFVTGTNKPDGIGHAIVEALLSSGGAQKVYATARHVQELESLVASHPAGTVVPVALDVTDRDALASLGTNYPDVTLVVNNAGYNASQSSLGDLDKAQTEMDINYIAPMAIGKSFAPVFAKLAAPSDENVQPSAFVNVSSMLGMVTIPMVGTYCSSKAAAHALTQTQRADLTKSLVIGVYPGAVETEMTKGTPYEKGTPHGVATALLEALVNGTEDVFPDPMAVQLHEGWKADAKAMEHSMAANYSAH
jgi:NAD(P)-dependent dehydrogenase (short-subunit alcohol dehydrogenase family)